MGEETMKEKVENYKAAPFDPRFPQWNGSAKCRQNFIDFHRCNSVMKAKGKPADDCKYFKLVYRDVCPVGWIEKWNEQVEEGVFPDRLNVTKH